MAIFNKLPPLNSKVVKHLIKFLALMAEPDVARVTFMTLENLAMVFAPSLLRCPSEDPMMILANAKKECQYLKNLILGLSPGASFSVTVIAVTSSRPHTPTAPADSDVPPPMPPRSALTRVMSSELSVSRSDLGVSQSPAVNLPPADSQEPAATSEQGDSQELTDGQDLVKDFDALEKAVSGLQEE